MGYLKLSTGDHTMTKKAKEDVDYSHGMPQSHCGKIYKRDDGYCKFFIEPEGCKKVEGTIRKIMWCKLFKHQEKE